MWQSVKVSNIFNTLTLKQIFWKTKTFLKKLEYRFLVETTEIGNPSCPFKTALSESNVKTNRMETTKWTYQKEWSFASNHFTFFGKFVPVLESSNINEVIRPVLNFFTIRFHKYKKAPKITKKYQNALKNTINLRLISLKFIDIRFISLNFIDIRFISLKFIAIRFTKFKKRLSGKK